MLKSPSQERSYGGPVSPVKTFSWKWEKRHYLLLIAGACLMLWFFSSQLKEASWVKSSLNYLPMLGGLVLVSEQLLKLVCL